MSIVARLKTKLRNYKYWAILDMISWAEGADYNTLFTGRTFSDFSRFPYITITSGRYTSSAAGRYQVMDFNWGEFAPRLGFKKFTPEIQDQFAVYLILYKRRVPESYIENPSAANLLKILKLIGEEWASLGFNSYGQPVKGVKTLTSRYEQFLAARKAGKVPDTSPGSTGGTTGSFSLDSGSGSSNTSLTGEYSQEVDISQPGVYFGLLTGENNCELPDFTQKSFLAYPGCLSKLAGAKISNAHQLGSSGPAMNADGSVPQFANEDQLRAFAKKGDLLYPLDKQYRVTSVFYARNRVNHKGTDIATPTGTPIYASCDGTISLVAYQKNGAGKHINLVSHDKTYWLKYFHLSAYKVTQGQKVKRGQLMALTGNTGASSGPHLHLELSVKNRLVNPEIFFDFRP